MKSPRNLQPKINKIFADYYAKKLFWQSIVDSAEDTQEFDEASAVRLKPFMHPKSMSARAPSSNLKKT
jgi:hypothetical protein